jgi:hypothetical protein
MITKFRACFWALSFGLFFHISLDEKHSPLAAICIGTFYTAIVDMLVSADMPRRSS